MLDVAGGFTAPQTSNTDLKCSLAALIIIQAFFTNLTRTRKGFEELAHAAKVVCSYGHVLAAYGLPEP